MRFANSPMNIEKFGGLVNGLAVLVIVSVIAAGYVSALGSFAGAV